MAQTESKPITEDELSAILAGNVDSVLTPSEIKEDNEIAEKVKAIDPVDDKENSTEHGFKAPIDEDFSWKEIAEENEEETNQSSEKEVSETSKEGDKQTEKNAVKTDNTATKGTPKKGTDFLSVINELIEEGELFGYEDGPVKSQDEVKELIKQNIQEAKKSTFEDIWQDKIESFSPQVQAILKYAESGGQDITPLLNAISEVEELNSFDVETERGQEAILSEFLKVSGWSDEDIKEEIETAKDLDKLKSKAEKFLPKLNQMNQDKIHAMMVEQEERAKVNETARQSYLTTIRNTLNKEKLADIKLSRQDKAMLWEGLTDVNYKSWSGQPTNKFFKKIEEIQAGKTADYDHFLEVVHMTLDPKGFKQKLKEQLKTESTVETARQLKVNQKRNSNSETLFEETTKKPTIRRTGFKNPFA